MALGSRTRTVSTQLQCEECDNLQTIHRRLSRQKRKNHLKHMYCPNKCQKVTEHFEVKNDPDLPQWLRERND